MMEIGLTESDIWANELEEESDLALWSSKWSVRKPDSPRVAAYLRHWWGQCGRCGVSKVEAIERGGQIGTEEFVGQSKEFGFYVDGNQETLEGFEQKRDML